MKTLNSNVDKKEKLPDDQRSSKDGSYKPTVNTREMEAVSPQSSGAEKPCYENPVNSEDQGRIEILPGDPLLDNPKDDEVKYKSMDWWHCGLLMIAECISLGILSLPAAMAALGLARCLLLIIILGIVAGYTGYVIGQFKLVHPSCHSMADAGEIMFGWAGRELFGVGQIIVLIFIMAAHVTSFTIMMNVETNHSTCSITFSIIALVVSFALTLPRTLKSMSFLSVASCLSILVAVLVTMFYVGIVKPGVGKTAAFATTSLTNGMNMALNIILAYSGHVTYFGFASELKEPRDFTKALIFLQVTAVSLYTTVAVVIYYYVGPSVPSPALGAASPLFQKIAYGIGSLTIVIAGVVNAHVASHYIYLRIWKATAAGERVVCEKSFRAYSSWFGICAAVWLISWIIAEAIPSFKHLLALVSALFSGWFSFGITGMFWIYINKDRLLSNWRKITLTVLNVAIFCIGCIICGLGLYATGTAISNGESGKSFSCADNSLPI